MDPQENVEPLSLLIVGDSQTKPQNLWPSSCQASGAMIEAPLLDPESNVETQQSEGFRVRWMEVMGAMGVLIGAGQLVAVAHAQAGGWKRSMKFSIASCNRLQGQTGAVVLAESKNEVLDRHMFCSHLPGKPVESWELAERPSTFQGYYDLLLPAVPWVNGKHNMGFLDWTRIWSVYQQTQIRRCVFWVWHSHWFQPGLRHLGFGILGSFSLWWFLSSLQSTRSRTGESRSHHNRSWSNRQTKGTQNGHCLLHRWLHLSYQLLSRISATQREAQNA